MKFLVDNNLSVNLANGMRAFGEHVEHLQDHLPANCRDEELLQFVGVKDYFLVTRDNAIRYNPDEHAAFKRYRVGAFFLGGKNLSKWEIIQQLVRNWPRIKDHADKTRRPFAVRVPPSGTKFKGLPLS